MGCANSIDIPRRLCNIYYMTGRARTSKTMTETLRKAMRDHLDGGGTFLGLQRDTGITRQSLMLFLRGETSLRLDIADKLAAYFQLELRPISKRKGK